MSAHADIRGRRRARGCVGALVLAALLTLLLLLVLGILVLRSRVRPLVGPGVSILEPRNGTRLDLEHGGMVVMEARSAEPVLRYELWVDGGRQGVVQPTADKARLSNTTQLRWVPDREGVHVLIAIAYDQRGLQGRSSPVVVEVRRRDPSVPVGVRIEVQPGDTAATLAERSGLDPELLDESPPADLQAGEVVLPVPWGRLPQGFFGEGGPEPASPAQEPPPAEWHLPPEMPQPPAGLVAEHAGGCQVHLAWQMDSPASDVRLHRYGGMAEDFSSVADIDPQASEYVDTVRWGGSYLYVVATFGPGGESPGPMARVEVPAEACPDEEPLPDSGTAWLQFEGVRVATQEAYDRLYCYFSLNGEEYQRIPAAKDSSLSLTEGGWDLTPYLAGIHRRVFQHDVQTSVSVRLECWGWRGNDLLPLGNLDDLFSRPEWTDGLESQARGFQLLFNLLAYQNDLPVLEPVIEADEPPPPPWHLSLGLSPLECLPHVNQGGGEDLYGGEGVLSQWACLEIPEYMLTWDWPSEEGWGLSDIDGYRVEVIRDLERWDPDEPQAGDLIRLGESGSANMAFPVSYSLPPCLRTFGFRVQAFRDTELRRLYSEPSPVLRVSRPDCPDAALVEFELADIEVDDLDDGCILFCGDESLQAYGSGQFVVIRSPWHSASTGDYSVWTNEARVDFWTDECSAGFGEGCLIQPRTVHNGPIDLAEEDLRVCQDGACSELGPGNNKVRLVLWHGDQVEFRFMLWDVDGVEDDVWCGTTEDIGLRDRARVGLGVDNDYESVPWVIGEIFGERTLRQWAEADFEDWFYNYAFGALQDQDAKCKVHVRIHGLGLARGS